LDVVGCPGSAAQVFLGQGDGTFTPGNIYNAPTTILSTGLVGSTSIVIADFNGDKKIDVAAFNTMLLGNGDGTLQGNPAVPGQFGFQAMGDFNGDGHPDFAQMGPIEQVGTAPNGIGIFAANVNVWLNDSKNNFTLAHSYPINITTPNIDNIGYLAIGGARDLNADGKLDLIGSVWDGSGLS